MTYEKRGRFWAVIHTTGELVCLCVYKKGARNVVRLVLGIQSDAARLLRGMRSE